LATSQLRRAIQQWSDCLAENRWPAYPDRICYPGVPPWEMAKEEGARV
jgi:hypothetical protein